MQNDWSEDIVVVDLADEPALSDELTDMAKRIETGQAKRVPHVVLNFSSVTYVNSSNLAQLLRLNRAVEAMGRVMKLCSINEEIMSVLMTTGLDKIFHSAPDPMTALAGIQLDDAEAD